MNDSMERAKAVVEHINYATVATANASGKPWNSPVAIIRDVDLNVYWFSDKHSQHSQNVRENGQIFIVIYDSTVPEGKGAGVYIEGRAVELNDQEDIRVARRLKAGTDQDAPEGFMGEAIQRVYRAVPERAWVTGVEMADGKFVRVTRVELPLDELKAALAMADGR